LYVFIFKSQFMKKCSKFCILSPKNDTFYFVEFWKTKYAVLKTYPWIA
jgi:hypothetical protein